MITRRAVIARLYYNVTYNINFTMQQFSNLQLHFYLYVHRCAGGEKKKKKAGTTTVREPPRLPRLALLALEREQSHTIKKEVGQATFFCFPITSIVKGGD